MGAEKIQIYDTTLRDGSQGEGVSFSVQDKVLIARKMDEMGFHFIEGGWPGANPKDIAFFEEIKKTRMKKSQVVAFGSTCKAHTAASEDQNLRGLLAADTEVITIFGKSWDMHVTEVFKTKLDENLRMIEDSVRYLRSKGKQVIYDAEHFFDGYSGNPAYAVRTLETALGAGASVLVLCDTNGGSMPSGVFKIVSEVRHKLPEAHLGIHTHNDCGLGIANALAAVEAGARHVQGTINGYGERCGNADLIAIVANLQIKLGFHCLASEKLKELTQTSRYVNEVSNMIQHGGQPYVGRSAFAHKGGVHIHAVTKNPKTYEHIDPALVGNARRFLVSELGGRTNILLKAKELGIDLEKDSLETRKILQEVQRCENEGYQYEAADASLELLMLKVMGRLKKNQFFEVKNVKIAQEFIGDKDTTAQAQVHIVVGKKKSKPVQAKGDGPVNALDVAFRKALAEFYPQIKNIRLDDYKVRIVDSKAGTAAKVRVFIEFKDEKSAWTTVGVSTNIIDASWFALVDAYEYKLMKRHSK